MSSSLFELGSLSDDRCIIIACRVVVIISKGIFDGHLIAWIAKTGGAFDFMRQLLG